MNVNLNIGQTANPNATRFNQNTTSKNANNTPLRASKIGRRDILSISPQGKKNSLIENLMKQKTQITDQKNSLISSTLKNGGTLDSIKSQLETYDEQMKSVDQQIAELMAKEMQKQTENVKEKEDSEPKTKEEIQNKRLADITNLSSDLQQTQTVSSVQSKVEGDARVLKSEIELDKQRAGSSPGAKAIIEKKEASLAVMEQKALDLTSDIGAKLADVTEKISDINKPEEVVPSEETENKTKNKTEKENTTTQTSSENAKDDSSEKVTE